jgi:hypothetical protein
VIRAIAIANYFTGTESAVDSLSIEFSSTIAKYGQTLPFTLLKTIIESKLDARLPARNFTSTGGSIMKAQEISIEKPSVWQQIFLQSKVNGAPYYGDLLPGRDWNWPRDSYHKRRLKRLRSRPSSDELALSPYDFLRK